MQAVMQDHSRTRITNRPISLRKGMGWGMFGGLVATLVMDLVLMAVLVAAGIPPFTCFSIVGDTVASLLSFRSILISGSILLGMAAHYLIGPVMGGIFGAALAKVNALRVDRPMKCVFFAVLFAEILSQPMLALSPILLAMTTSTTLQWYGGSLVMHLIWGCVMGMVVYWGLRLPIAANPS